MREFTFISITYNHENYIIEHLESMKTVIQHYGKEIQIDYLLSDDGSKDRTREIAEEWLKNNSALFRRYVILNDGENHGTVRNCLRAINHLKTKRYKFLAGDDMYLDKNLFALFEGQEKCLVLTPILAFGREKEKRQIQFDEYFRLLKYLGSTRKITRLITMENHFAAPGVFICGDGLSDAAFQTFLLQFRNIEDYPMWYYLLTKLKYSVKIVDEQYIAYRTGDGFSTSEKAKKEFRTEREHVRKALGSKLFKYPKYINPYKYLLRFYRFRANRADRHNKK